jgi:hypothetical protein
MRKRKNSYEYLTANLRCINTKKRRINSKYNSIATINKKKFSKLQQEKEYLTENEPP